MTRQRCGSVSQTVSRLCTLLSFNTRNNPRPIRWGLLMSLDNFLFLRPVGSERQAERSFLSRVRLMLMC